MKITNKSIQRVDKGEFCPKCYSNNIQKQKDGNFFCSGCKAKSERSIIIDKKIKYWFDKENNYWHESVGAFIFNDNNQLLLIKLSKFPFGYSIPAGHVNSSEMPEDSATREVLEEVGIRPEKMKNIMEYDLDDDPCRRGADHHKWHIYEFHVKELDKITINDESSCFEWVELEAALKYKLTSPARRFIKKYIDDLVK